jgi:peroxiredoxin
MRFARFYGKLSALVLLAGLIIPLRSFAMPKKGDPAPPLQVVTLGGQKVSLQNYRNSVLVIEFFATWCGGCKESIPHLLNLNKQYGSKGLQILGLDIGQGDDAAALRQFVAKRKINFPVAMADEDLVYDSYAVRMIPTIFVINKKGILVDRFTGYTAKTERDLESTIRKLVAE